MSPARVVVEADGGSRGNPGPAGYGAAVFDADTGEVLAEAKASIGTATNNVAEYHGLIAGLSASRDLGATVVAVRMDSKLVVEQMKGTWKIKNEGLRPLASEAAGLVRAFDAVTFEWIPREKNKHADRLANEAMDEAAGVAPKAARSATSRASRADEPVPEPAGATVSTRPATGSWGPPTTTATRLVLVRHGATEHSADRRFSGRNDLPLSAAGQQQAAALATRAFGDVAAVVASPLPRTVETASAVAAVLGHKVETIDGLVETDFGEWEGRTAAEVYASDPDALGRWRASLDAAPPGGESFSAVQARVTRAVGELTARFPDQAVLLVSHVTPIKLILGAALRAVEAALYRIHLDTASVSVVDLYADGNASVRLVNDTSHLRGGDPSQSRP